MKKATVISTFQFLERFPDEPSAVSYLENLRWSSGVVCPLCSARDKASRRKGEARRGVWRCKSCRKDFTVRTGTIFARSHISLRKWLYSMYLLETSRKGISSLQLSKEIGVQQKSAWFLLHRLREAGAIAAKKLSGVVEIDETYIGGKESNKHENKQASGSQGGSGKQVVIGMRERGGRIKAKSIAKTDIATMNREVGSAVEFGATVYTDDHPAYNRLHTAYQHGTVKHSAKEYVNGMAHTNGIESVWAVMKRGYNGVYHNWSKKHLHRYINEFVFRLNEGNVNRNTMDRVASLCLGAEGKRLTYMPS